MYVGDNSGCFGASKKKKDGAVVTEQRHPVSGSRGPSNRQGENTKGMELLWQPEVTHNINYFLGQTSQISYFVIQWSPLDQVWTKPRTIYNYLLAFGVGALFIISSQLSPGALFVRRLHLGF